MEKTFLDLLSNLEYQLENVQYYNGSRCEPADCRYTLSCLKKILREEGFMPQPCVERFALYAEMAINEVARRINCISLHSIELTPTEMLAEGLEGVLYPTDHHGEPGCSDWCWYPGREPTVTEEEESDSES